MSGRRKMSGHLTSCGGRFGSRFLCRETEHRHRDAGKAKKNAEQVACINKTRFRGGFFFHEDGSRWVGCSNSCARHRCAIYRTTLSFVRHQLLWLGFNRNWEALRMPQYARKIRSFTPPCPPNSLQCTSTFVNFAWVSLPGYG